MTTFFPKVIALFVSMILLLMLAGFLFWHYAC